MLISSGKPVPGQGAKLPPDTCAAPESRETEGEVNNLPGVKGIVLRRARARKSDRLGSVLFE